MAGATSRTLVHWWITFCMVTGVSAVDTSLVALICSGVVSAIFLVGVIFFIGLMFVWSDWFKNIMANKGKVRMPKAYWKKKQEAKRRLLSTSQDPPSVVNGNLPAQSVDRAPEPNKAAYVARNGHAQKNLQTYVPNRIQSEYHTPLAVAEQGQSSYVQGWNQNANQFGNKAYEEKDVTMELGEEVDDEFRIETVLTDNEVLDVGPFKSEHSNEKAIQGDIYPEPYIYTTVDSAKRQSPRGTAAGTTMVSTTVPSIVDGPSASTEMQEVRSGASGGGEVVTSFEDMLVQL